MSIIEALIAGSVLSILLVMIAQFVGPMLRMTQESSFKVEMQQEGTRALNGMVAELQRTTSTGVSIATGLPTQPVVLATDRIYNIDGTGFPEYEKALQIFCFTPSNGRLFRKTYSGPPDPPSIPLPFSAVAPVKVTLPATLFNIATTVNNTERNLALNVQKFYVTTNGAGTYQLALVLQQDIPNTQKKAVVELARRVFLRNN